MLSHGVFVRSDAVVSRLIGGETLVVPVRGDVGDLASIYRFNEVGSTIWDALANPVNIDELTGVVTREYEVDDSRARQDIETFLREMGAAGLVSSIPVEAANRGQSNCEEWRS